MSDASDQEKFNRIANIVILATFILIISTFGITKCADTDAWQNEAVAHHKAEWYSDEHGRACWRWLPSEGP